MNVKGGVTKAKMGKRNEAYSTSNLGVRGGKSMFSIWRRAREGGWETWKKGRRDSLGREKGERRHLMVDTPNQGRGVISWGE